MSPERPQRFLLSVVSGSSLMFNPLSPESKSKCGPLAYASFRLASLFARPLCEAGRKELKYRFQVFYPGI
jgi:hypothetical protein